jgi:periplasmic protein TonB
MRRFRWGLSVSVAAHAGLVAAVFLLPLLAPTEQPALANPNRVFMLPPPAAAAPPPLRGASGSRRVRTASAPVPVRLEVPVPIPAAEPLPSEPAAPELPEAPLPGDPEGSDTGDPEGLPGGREGGSRGGVPWGAAGGCPGCAGDGPVTDWDQAPKRLRQVVPVYPHEAFVTKVQGTVVLEILIDARGRVADARVVQTLTPALDAAALAAVRQWTFTPAFRRGRPVAMWARAPVEFRIR